MDEDLIKLKCEILYCTCCEYEDYFLTVMTQCGLKNNYQFLEECKDTILKEKGARGGVVVKTLRYKPAGRGFDSRLCHWNFPVT